MKCSLYKVFFSFFILQFSFYSFSFSQPITFEKTYGGNGFEDVHMVKPTFDGGYIVAGSSGSYGNGSNDAMLLKIDSLGNQQWLKIYGGTEEEDIHFLSITSDSGFIFCGFSNSFSSGDNDVYVVKTNKSGDTLWTKTYGGVQDDMGYCIQQTLDGNYIIIGKTNSFGNGSFDIYLLKIDALGNSIFQKTFGKSADDYARFIELTSDSGYILTGTTFNTDSSDAEIILLKTNSIGDSLWAKTFDHDSLTFGYAVQQTLDGGFIMAGYGFHYDWQDNYSLLAIKTDSMGNESWRSIPSFDVSSGKSNVHSIRQTNDGGYILAGANNVEIICKTSADSGYYPSNLLLVKLDVNGSLNWYKEYYNTNGFNELGTYADQTSDNGYIVCGYKGFDYSTDGDAFIIKTDSIGNILTGITESLISGNTNVLIFPNPFSNSATIEINAGFHSCHFVIYDLMGREIKKINILKSPFIFYRDNLPEGIYFYQAVTDKNKIIAKGKMIVL